MQRDTAHDIVIHGEHQEIAQPGFDLLIGPRHQMRVTHRASDHRKQFGNILHLNRADRQVVISVHHHPDTFVGKEFVH